MDRETYTIPMQRGDKGVLEITLSVRFIEPFAVNPSLELNWHKILYPTGASDNNITFITNRSSASDKLSAFKSEQQAFYSMKTQLEKEYWGKYVAIYGGRVVDSDINESNLIHRFFETYGDVPVYIDKVGENRIIKMRSPRRAR